MKRPISFVLHICIITIILFYGSVCAEQVKLVQTTAGMNVPAHILNGVAINNFEDANNERSSGTRSFHDEDKLDYAHKNESSQGIGDDIVYLPKSTGHSIEHRNENSDTQSIVESQMHKRAVEPQDICDTNECKCKFETKFLTVDCHFQQVSTFIQLAVFIGFLLLKPCPIAIRLFMLFHIEVQCYN